MLIPDLFPLLLMCNMHIHNKALPLYAFKSKKGRTSLILLQREEGKSTSIRNGIIIIYEGLAASGDKRRPCKEHGMGCLWFVLPKPNTGGDQ